MAEFTTLDKKIECHKIAANHIKNRKMFKKHERQNFPYQNNTLKSHSFHEYQKFATKRMTAKDHDKKYYKIKNRIGEFTMLC